MISLIQFNFTLTLQYSFWLQIYSFELILPRERKRKLYIEVNKCTNFLSLSFEASYTIN